MISVFLADDHPIVRQGLHSLLATESDLEIVGEAGDGLETVEAVTRLRPEVLVADLMMPGLSGLEVASRLRENSPATAVIILSMHASDAYVAEAMRSGAVGYVLKESSTRDLVRAVRAVARGGRWLSPPLSEERLREFAARSAAAAGPPEEPLTARERDVMARIAEGRTTAEIAADLCLSPRTVESHRASLTRKLGLRTPADIVRYAIRRGVIPLDSEP